MNQERVGAEVQGELCKILYTEMPDAERMSIFHEKPYQKARLEQGYKYYFKNNEALVKYII